MLFCHCLGTLGSCRTFQWMSVINRKWLYTWWAKKKKKSQPEEVECTKDLGHAKSALNLHLTLAHFVHISSVTQSEPFPELKLRVQKKDGICPGSGSSRHGDADGKARTTLGFLTGLIRYVHQGEKLGSSKMKAASNWWIGTKLSHQPFLTQYPICTHRVVVPAKEN